MKNSLKVVIVVIVAIILIGTAFLVLYHPTEQFTDTAQTAAPEQLDPATGFFTTNGPLFSAVFNTLVEFNGSSTSVVPVLASNYTVVHDQNYTFDIRPYAKFSNGQQLNASSVWFSFERGIIMGQGPYASDYSGILFNGTCYANTSIGIALPNGTIPALESAGYTITGNMSQQYKTAAMDLDNILSHFNYNATEMKVMTYKGQALVVNSNDNVSINTMVPYAYLLSDIAGWWGDIVEPSYVDAHGGVTYNSPNSYTDANGVIGSGPYIISSVGKGFSTIVLKANPNYWVDGHNSSVPAIAQPAHIKTVVIKYGLSHADRLEDFDRGISQISTIAPTSFKQMIDGYHIAADRNTSLVKSYPEIGNFYISMNVHDAFTNNTHFREALYDAMNYTAELKVYNNNYNRSAEAYQELGPLSPIYGHAYYNPDNFSLPTQNLTAAIQNLTMAGHEMNFYVKLPSGKYIGNTTSINSHATDLSKHTFTLTGISPLNTVETSELTIAVDSFSDIGLKFTTSAVTESTVSTWTNASATPQFVDLGWLPDYPDPIGQQLIPVYDVADGGAFGGNDAWVDNSTLQTYFKNLDFQNKSTQLTEMKDNVSRLVYDQYAYVWMPMPNDVWFVAPDVHGFVFNSITSSYFYNLMTVSGKLTSSVGYMSIYTLVANIEMAITDMAPKF
ncbi:MAG: ABC transporter substrate-binding protein [Candidatus Thermoplasmatota archaeon]|nr:ABC transporter substrate-binding protein [Candidatus Thermoplasmatota archaeon]